MRETAALPAVGRFYVFFYPLPEGIIKPTSQNESTKPFKKISPLLKYAGKICIKMISYG